MSRRRLLFTVAVGLLAAILAVAGYAIGAARAPTDVEAALERAQAERRAFVQAQQQASQKAKPIGYKAGRQAGERRGRRVGQARGERARQKAAAQQKEQQAQAAEAERQQRIEQRVQERAENCNAPLFADGYCPTDEEIERESQAESLCGPATEAGRQEAARLGIQC